MSSSAASTLPPDLEATHEAAQAAQAALAAQADAVMAELLAEEEAEQAQEQARSKKSKKKKNAGQVASGGEASTAPPAAQPDSPPAASATEQAEEALRAAMTSGGLAALEAALAAAPFEVREGGVGAEARARRDQLLEEHEAAERQAKKEAAEEAAELAAAERAWKEEARDTSTPPSAPPVPSRPAVVAFELQQLRDLTNDFDEGAQVGRGGFGTVYQANTLDGQPVAIKRGEKVDQTFELKELKREVRARQRHRCTQLQVTSSDDLLLAGEAAAGLRPPSPAAATRPLPRPGGSLPRLSAHAGWVSGAPAAAD